LEITIIIPTRNRAEILKKTLDSINNLNSFDLEWEVLIIDNASTDDTKDVVNRISKESNYPIRYIYEKNVGLHFARNRAVTETKSNIVAYLDDDVVVEPNWLKGAVCIRENKCEAVIGKILPLWEITPPKYVLEFLRGGIYGPYSILDCGEKRIHDFKYFFGGNLFILRDIIIKLKGFHPDGFPQKDIIYRGDGEGGFFRKFSKAGYRCYYEPEAAIYHVIPSERINLNYLKRRYYNQGISDSFTKIRKLYEVDKINTLSKKNISLSIIYHILILIYNACKGVCTLLTFNHVNKYGIIKLILLFNSLKGYYFHQSKVIKNTDLFHWVIKDNYLTNE